MTGSHDIYGLVWYSTCDKSETMKPSITESAGIPRRGEITEIIGRLSSGRTSLVLTFIADVTARGGAVALVDADDAFDPLSGARTGIDLHRLLWVRCGGRRHTALAATDVLVRCPGFALIVLDTGEVAPRLTLALAFRLRLAVRRANTALVILARRRIAGAAATIAIEATREAIEWSGARHRPTRLAGLRTIVQMVRPEPGGRAVDPELWWRA